MNVCGMSNNLKKKKIFNYLHSNEVDIVFLQETHSIKKDERIWKSMWGGRVYFSHGESNTRGVCILVKRRTPIKITHSYADRNGRWIILDIVYNGINISLCNIYALNDDNLNYFEQMFRSLKDANSLNRIIGSDSNLVMELEKDKIGGNKTTHSKSLKIVQDKMQRFTLIDIWRKQHPYESIFTWCRTKPKVIAER